MAVEEHIQNRTGDAAELHLEARPSFWTSTFASLGERDYAWFFTGNFCFFMAIQMQFILLGYLTFDITGSAKAIGLISAAFAGPTFFISPISGVIADRVHKRRILATIEGIAIAVSAALGVLILAGLIEFWHLAVTSLVFGVCMSLNMPARQALVPELVPRHRLMNSISLMMGSINLTRILSPALAGVLISVLGAGWVYMLSAGLFLTAGLAETQLPKHGMTGHGKTTSFVEEIQEGFSYIWRHETVRLMIITSIMIPMLAFPVQQMLPVFAREVFSKGPSGLGLLAAMAGVGGLIGAVAAANLDRYPEKGRLLLLGGVMMAVFTFAFALSPSFELALLPLVLGSVGQLLFMTTNNTIIQANLPGEIRGRVVSVMMMSFGLTPLGVFPVSAAADAFGAPATIAFTAVLLLATVFLLFWFSPRLRNLRVDALERTALSPVQAAALVAEGQITEDEAKRLSGARSL